MESAIPTRQNLMKLRHNLGVVEKGQELLRSKREALMKEFLGLVDECLRMRQANSALMAKARRNLEFSRAANTEAVGSLEFVSARHISIDIEVRNVWGVKVPEIRYSPLVRSLGSRDISPMGESTSSLDTARDFERVVDSLLELATPETRLARVGEIIKSDTRKINAIREVLLPGIKGRIKGIERVLEEREKEGIYRMKRYKLRRSGY